MDKIFLIGASSVIANTFVNDFIKTNESFKLVKITRNPKFKNDNNFHFVNNYEQINEVFSLYTPSKNDLIILAFAYLGKTGYDENLPISLEIENQNKVFEVNLKQMKTALNFSTNFLKNLGGTVIYFSSAAAYPVRNSNIPYGLSKRFIDEFIKKQRPYFKKTNIKVLSVRTGFVDTPLNKGRDKTPFSSTPEKVSKAIMAALRKNKKIVYVPGILSVITKIMTMLPRISNYLDKNLNN